MNYDTLADGVAALMLFAGIIGAYIFAYVVSPAM
jgi:hypothetical protein